MSIDTINGNSAGGIFSISLLGSKTCPLSHEVSFKKIESAIICDIPSILSADVIRHDHINNCDDGLCMDGPQQAGAATNTNDRQ